MKRQICNGKTKWEKQHTFRIGAPCSDDKRIPMWMLIWVGFGCELECVKSIWVSSDKNTRTHGGESRWKKIRAPEVPPLGLTVHLRPQSSWRGSKMIRWMSGEMINRKKGESVICVFILTSALPFTLYCRNWRIKLTSHKVYYSFGATTA